MEFTNRREPFPYEWETGREMLGLWGMVLSQTRSCGDFSAFRPAREVWLGGYREQVFPVSKKLVPI